MARKHYDQDPPPPNRHHYYIPVNLTEGGVPSPNNSNRWRFLKIIIGLILLSITGIWIKPYLRPSTPQETLEKDIDKSSQLANYSHDKSDLLVKIQKDTTNNTLSTTNNTLYFEESIDNNKATESITKKTGESSQVEHYSENKSDMPVQIVNHTSNKTLYFEESIDNKTTESTWPDVAWLASFPNSGTSYTMRLTHTVSNTCAATNYIEGDTDTSGNSILIRPDLINGPYKLNSKYVSPKKFILTKTHCGSRCGRCPPKKYITSKRDFLTECLRANRRFRDEDGKLKSEHVHYDIDIVKKVIHLVRDPFDNIVSRFHNHFDSETNKDWLKSHPRDKHGFRAYCDDKDNKDKKGEKEVFSKQIIDFIRDIPCHKEFFLYVQWHNLFFQTVKDHNLTSFILYYEDYDQDFNGTVAKIFDFLELDIVRPPPAFHSSDYSDHYSDEVKSKAIEYMKMLTNDKTRELLKSYLYD